MGQLTLGEQAAPSTPASGNTIYTTVATPSILRVINDSGVDCPFMERGSWTPTLYGSSTPGTQVYSTQAGRYVRQGWFVAAWFQVTLSTKDAAFAGDVTLGGLPYTAANLSSLTTFVGSECVPVSLATNVVWLTVRVTAATTTALFRKMTAAAAVTTALVAADINSTTALNGVCVYEVA